MSALCCDSLFLVAYIFILFLYRLARVNLRDRITISLTLLSHFRVINHIVVFTCAMNLWISFQLVAVILYCSLLELTNDVVFPTRRECQWRIVFWCAVVSNVTLSVWAPGKVSGVILLWFDFWIVASVARCWNIRQHNSWVPMIMQHFDFILILFMIYRNFTVVVSIMTCRMGTL